MENQYCMRNLVSEVCSFHLFQYLEICYDKSSTSAICKLYIYQVLKKSTSLFMFEHLYNNMEKKEIKLNVLFCIKITQ